MRGRRTPPYGGGGHALFQNSFDKISHLCYPSLLLSMATTRTSHPLRLLLLPWHCTVGDTGLAWMDSCPRRRPLQLLETTCVIKVENSLQSYISVGVYPPEEVEDGGEVPENVWGIHGRDGPGRVRFYTWFVSLRNIPNMTHVHELDVT